MLKKRNPSVVTRFIGQSRLYDKTTGTVTTAVYKTKRNMQTKEISVVDIDKELANNQQEQIFKLADRVYPNSPARADLFVADIESIEPLKVYPDFWNPKHCNIRPFPSEEAAALNFAGRLVKVSHLVIR